MKRAGLNEVLEGQLYQRGQFLTWPYEQKWRLLREHRIDVVVNLWGKVDPDLADKPGGLLYIVWPTSPSEVPADSGTMIALLARMMLAGKRLLIHCEAGHGRSAWLSAEVVKATLLADPGAGQVAYGIVAAAVPGISINRPLKEHLLR